MFNDRINIFQNRIEKQTFDVTSIRWCNWAGEMNVLIESRDVHLQSSRAHLRMVYIYSRYDCQRPKVGGINQKRRRELSAACVPPTFATETYTRIPDMYPAGQIRLRL